MSNDNTQDAAEPSPASAGSHGDTLSVLRTLIDGVRGMGLGDPDCGDRIEASDVVRWAVDEIERLRLTDAELKAVGYFGQIEGGQYLDAANRHAAALRGLLERLK